ncbi:sulfotransferase [Flagellimonas marinaquae]
MEKGSGYAKGYLILLLKGILGPRRYALCKRVADRFRWKGSHRVFVISYQRTGTTSVADFFRYHGYPVASVHHAWKNNWHRHWYDGNFEAIFKSLDFKCCQVFQDEPFYYPEFYKYLFHRFPKARFVLFDRNADAWFNSMHRFKNGKNLGNTRIESKVYRREQEFYEMLDNNNSNFMPCNTSLDRLMELSGHERHYKQIYETRNREVMEFFSEHGPDRLFSCSLEDSEKWQKMGTFFNIKVPKDFEMHSNRTIKKGTEKIKM